MSIDQLQMKIRKMKNPTMVGIDPILERIPEALRREAFAAHGETLRGAAEAYRTFSCGILDALNGLVPAVKIQTGCFQALGHDGMAAMEEVTAYAREKGYYVLLDTMRGDIDVTAQALAASCFGQIQVGSQTYTPFASDGVIINAYLGSDGIKPFTQYCRQGKNVFILARTSNKSAREIQDMISGDRIVHQVIMDLAMRWSVDLYGKSGYSEIGVAVAGTQPQLLKSLRAKYDRLFFLVPGYGAQGANGRDVQYAFDKAGHGAVVAAGRSILYAYEKFGGDGADYQARAVKAAEMMRNNILTYVTVL